MKSKWLLLGVIAAAMLVITACSKLPNDVSADASSSGKQIEITASGTLTVTLDSNATTGYSWELAGISDTGVLEKTDNKYEAPTSGLMGAGGKEVWTFKALKAGTTTLSMDYSQPWVGGQKGANSFSLTIVVK
jgi:inhibitor of cysteine peptidase